MASSVAELQRIGCRVFAASSSVGLDGFVPIFHRWIQTGAVDGLLIDVADYAHVENGPGILLIAYEGNYAVDVSEGRVAMQYCSKQPIDGDLSRRLRRVCSLALRAAHLLRQESGLNGALGFGGNELRIYANDRLRAPNSDETMRSFQPALDDLVTALYEGAACELKRASEPGARFAVDLTAPEPVDLATLVQRLG